MKTINEFLNENKTDAAIDNALNLMNTSEDIESLGEAFARKYSSNILSALVEFIDGIEIVANSKLKDDNLVKNVTEIRNFIKKL